MLATIRFGRRMLGVHIALDADLLVWLLDVDWLFHFYDGILVMKPILTTMSGIVSTPNCGIAFIPETEDAEVAQNHWRHLLRSCRL